MGYGLPAAMGAALGRPDKESWAIVGDGGLQMTSQEFMTAVADHIPVKVALLDNGKLGMIRQWQEMIYGGKYHSSNLPGPDWAKLAEAYGVPCFRATHARGGGPRHPCRAGRGRPGAGLVPDRRDDRTCSR